MSNVIVEIPQPLISLNIGIRYLLNWRILHLGSQMSYNRNLQKIHSSEWLLTEFDLRWWVPIHASSTEFHNHYGHRLFRLLYCSNFPCWIFNSIKCNFKITNGFWNLNRNSKFPLWFHEFSATSGFEATLPDLFCFILFIGDCLFSNWLFSKQIDYFFIDVSCNENSLSRSSVLIQIEERTRINFLIIDT